MNNYRPQKYINNENHVMGHMRHQQIIMKFVSSKFRAKTLKNTIVRPGRKKFRKYRGFDLLMSERQAEKVSRMNMLFQNLLIACTVSCGSASEVGSKIPRFFDITCTLCYGFQTSYMNCLETRFPWFFFYVKAKYSKSNYFKYGLRMLPMKYCILPVKLKIREKT